MGWYVVRRSLRSKPAVLPFPMDADMAVPSESVMVEAAAEMEEDEVAAIPPTQPSAPTPSPPVLQAERTTTSESGQGTAAPVPTTTAAPATEGASAEPLSSDPPDFPADKPKTSGYALFVSEYIEAMRVKVCVQLTVFELCQRHNVNVDGSSDCSTVL